ncbi:MAG: glucose-1-phosphate adenylyltransferase [Rhodocyclaceae bacterium]|nr:glucose-1-phosphate adenylyltransferase [Rhodocyclaceae bacterium]
MQDQKEALRQIHTTTRSGQGPRYVSQLTRDSFALILAGGRGSRLKQLTDWRSKPAVPFAGKFRIIDFTLSNCVNSGIRRIGVATQYKSQSLIHHLQRGWSFLDGRLNEFVDLLPAQQQIGEDWYKGTSDAVFQNLDMLRRHHPKYVVVLSGDHVYKMDYGRLLAFHVAEQADMTVACIEVPREEASDFGIISVAEDWRVTRFTEKPKDPESVPGKPDRSLVSMGVYVFNAAFLFEQVIRDRDDPNSSHDFGKDVLPHIVERYRVFAHDFAESCIGCEEGRPYWRDVGTLDAYWEANMDIIHVTPELNLYDDAWPIWTHQEQLPPAKFIFDDDDRRGMAIDSMVSGNCIISGAAVRRSVLFSGVRVEERSVVEDAVILPKVRIGQNVVIRRAIIDKRCRIPDGMRIGVDREEDARRFHISEKGITLVTPEMLGQQVHRLR